MLEKSVSVLSSASLLWTSMNSWLTPTVLFLILNLVIATILFTSNRRTTTTTTHGDGPPSVLQRLKSFNFQTHLRSTPDSETHYFFQDSTGSAEATVTGGDLSRTRSDTEPASGSVPAKMRKSASLKSVFGHFKEDDVVEARRPATTRESGRVGEGDEEVDAKADDFINRFKQQLKLQRLDSIINRRKTNEVK